ncbi:ABC transporter permease [Actinocorallia sp. A-T 12471]|uniref:ABC transporter permease n=1 Tax=Actinocorallia sp. A-T 12471 TaxID=3089813 RepID=UPI0029CDA83E|nr:ABC transporter permease [Actinocorallia sp. A-T 12471]MDX6744439.1 ABC transporter permease [Actinocorallia sp. A-T 12471]
MRRAPFRAGRRPRPVEPTVFGLRDLLDEALAAMLARPGRAALTVLGTLLGVAAFVAVLGLTATASGQISARFTALSATEVLVEDAPEDPATADEPYPADAEARLTRLNGVRAAGLFWQPSTGDETPLVYARPPGLGDPGEQLTVTAASPGYLDAVHAAFRAGRGFDSWHEKTGARVAVLGRAAAARLGITRVEEQPAVFVGDTAFTVIGVIDDVERHAETLLSVLVPANTASALWGAPETAGGMAPKLLIDTELGAARLIGDQAPLALRPDQPGRFKVTVPPDPKELKTGVNADLGTLFLALAAICLLIGAVGIANTTLVAVLERTGEIGLRRALGARGRHIAAQFLAESAFLGLLGGLTGASLGVVAVVATAVAQRWTPVLEPLTVLPAPLIGALTGLVAGLYPAWRATRIEPVEALRR